MDDTTQVNIPLLRKAVEWAEVEAAKPATECMWEQREWVSDPRDRAFYAAVRELGDDAMAHALNKRAQELQPGFQCGTAYCIAGWVAFETVGIKESVLGHVTSDGVEIDDHAQEALGLLPRDAHRLFDACNTIEDVRRIAEEIAGERL